MAYGSKPSDFTFVGMVGILDPPRAGVVDAIKTLQRSGVQVKMLTGDSEETACAIGKIVIKVFYSCKKYDNLLVNYSK